MEKRVAIVTGSAKGLGKMSAMALAQMGINVVINYVHSQKEAEETANFIAKTYSVQTLAVQGDMGKISDVQHLVTETVAKMGSIDILIHNAGPFIREKKKLSDYTFAEWQQMIDGNLNSSFYLLKEILPMMQTKQWGRIVMLGFDKVGQAPAWKYRSAYAAAKAGNASLTRTLALEEAENGITVNLICPGDITGEWKEMTIEGARMLTAKASVSRPEVGEDIARVVAFLCDEKSDKISGAIIEVTGGKDILAKRNQE